MTPVRLARSNQRPMIKTEVFNNGESIPFLLYLYVFFVPQFGDYLPHNIWYLCLYTHHNLLHHAKKLYGMISQERIMFSEQVIFIRPI